MRVAFYCPDSVYESYFLTGRVLEDGIGGAESALINLSKRLALLGIRVDILNSVSIQQEVDGVTYRPRREATDIGTVDVFVLFRFYDSIISRVAADIKVLWSHDLPTNDSPYRMAKSYSEVDVVCAVSNYHATILSNHIQECGVRSPPEIFVGGNGVELSAYSAARDRPQVPTFIYCSVPDRGLLELRYIWPLIRRRLPEAKLFVTGGFGLWGRSDVSRWSQGAEGVVDVGIVPRRELVELQMKSHLHLHPCPVEELFCLSSIECQAAGTPSICSDAGALPETVRHGKTGVVVPGLGKTSAFHARFADTAVDCFVDVENWRSLSHGASLWASHFDYDLVARRWLQSLQG